jgi:hypothetical protein
MEPVVMESIGDIKMAHELAKVAEGSFYLHMKV